MSELKPESENTEERLSDTSEREEINKENTETAEDEDFFYDDNDAYEARRAARLERRNKARRRRKRMHIAGGVAVVAAAAIGIGVGFYGEELQTFFSEQQTKITQMVKSAGEKKEKDVTPASAEAENTPTPEPETAKEKLSKEDKALYAQAKHYAQQYDYDKAIELLKSSSTYKTSTRFKKAVKSYQKKKDSCVSWPLDQVTHVFYHTLIRDTGKAFDGDYKSGDYDQVMTTIDEFNQITQSMYEKGFVMVSIYDMATADENGNMNMGEILLPPGKVPFVLSQDDVCYYHYMDGDGFASKLVVDEEGKIRNEYVEDDGSISVGDYDMVPLIDRFVEEHPDFSYRGAKGIVALTGYNGILGYRTDSSYETRPDDLDADKVKWLDEHPDFDLNTEREGASEVAQAMKDEGWLFASHTWGHQNVSQVSLERLQADTQKFKENVDPLIGGTDIIIFAFGADLAGAEDYSGEKFEYLKGQGYNYFCNVDSSQYFVQIRSNYFRQGRRNLDGYRMYYNPELLTDLFDAQSVFDSSRPVPVPTMG
ncbi:MAG: polysaccharide deacetylase family protein [Eubacteriales bacterium]|nr:polysaccharide deacetylase family protein [Eubacteriales bacterium]